MDGTYICKQCLLKVHNSNVDSQKLPQSQSVVFTRYQKGDEEQTLTTQTSQTKTKGKRKVQGVPQTQTAALPRHHEEEETDKTKQAQIEHTYEEALRLNLIN